MGVVLATLLLNKIHATETSKKPRNGSDLTKIMTFSLRTRTRFGTWNIRTLLKTTRMAQVTREFRKYNIAVLGLCEVRWKGSGRKAISTGEILLYSGKDDDSSSSGVGILLNRDAEKCLVDWKPISDRIITARFKTRARYVTFVQVYAPTEQASLDEKEAFYRQLAETFRKSSKADIKILSGDLNAKVGNNNKDWEAVMGRHGLGNMNENGELFADFCVNQDLVIGGTLFRHQNIHKATWVSPDGKTKNQIDHIAISKRWRSSLLDVRNRRGADVYSDHHLVVGEIRIKLETTARRSFNTARKFNIAKLKQQETADEFREQMRQNLEQRHQENGTTNQWNRVVEAFRKTSESVLGFCQVERKEWISDNTWDLIEERKAIKGQLNANATPELTQQYKALDKRITKSARSDKRHWVDENAREAQKAADAGNIREMYRITKKLSNRQFKIERPLKDKSGNLLTMTEQQTERWSEYFEELLNKPPPSCSHSPSTPRAPAKVKDTPPSNPEIKEAIKQLKSGKSGGSDGIAPEMLKVDLDLMVEVLSPILREVWNAEEIPPGWKEGLIVKVPKKGDPSNCENWRGITLLNTVNKILAIIIHTRVSCALEPQMRKEQAGFRPQRSCTDHINALRIIIEQTVELQTPLILLFVDFERAFDTLNHERMWIILENYGIPSKVINIIKGLYKDVTCRVVHNRQLGRPIFVKSGVKQGCILSPLLFTLILDWVMKNTTKEPRGIQWLMATKLEDLDFADDICLLSQRESDIKEKLSQLIHYAAQVGLKINARKTKLMQIGSSLRQRNIQLNVENIQIENVDQFVYLGSVISRDGGADSDIQSRIKKARQTYGQLNNIWNSSNITQRIKLRLFKSNVMSVLLYGCETWRVMASTTEKLQVFVNRCLRRILHIKWSDYVTNEHLWERADMMELRLTIKQRKWRWIGHTLRRGNGEIARQALDWNPHGARKRGRPKQTWRRTVETEAREEGKTWKEVKSLAQNRVRWRGFCDALCSH